MSLPVPFPLRPLLILMAVASLSACNLGPDYQRPAVPESAEYRQAKGWKPAKPADVFHKDAWWELYEDPLLNKLVTQLNQSNQTVAVAEAQYLQANALVKGAWAQRMPTVTSSGEYTRSVSSTGGTTSSGSGSGGGSTSGGGYDYDGDGDYDQDDEYFAQQNGLSGGNTGSSSGGSSSSRTNDVRERYDFGLNISWSADLWGNLRRNQESQQALKEASAADLAAVRLTQQASLVQTYLQLRVLDAQQRLLDRTVEAYRRSLRLTKNQYEAGIVAKLDTTQAESQLKSTEAQAVDLKWQRAQYEHAIAILIGIAPSELRLSERNDIPKVPDIPLSVPSRLLERRPDVASAERNVISANAAIGMAETAWFPDLSLTANGGFSNDSMGHIFSVPYRYWSIGPKFSQTVLDFGARRSELRRAEASYDQQVANYRQTVLDSLREVEDYLSQVRVLEKEMEFQAQATDAAKESLRLMENQYRAGMIDYLSVVNLQTSALSSERSLLSQQSSRLTASVQLIAALGGGWNGEAYPDPTPEELAAQAAEAEKQRLAAENAGLMDKMKDMTEKSLTWLKEYL